MRKRRDLSERVEVQNPEVKARVLAVLQSLSGEKSVSEICRETGLQQMQFYKLEGQILRGMEMAAEASLVKGRKRNPLTESRDLEDRNRKLRQEMLRTQAMLRLSRKLFKVTRRGRKPGPKPGRPRKDLPPLKIEEQPAIAPIPKD